MVVSGDYERPVPVHYERFHIGTEQAPPGFTIPNKFDVKAKRLRLAAMLIHEAFHYHFKKEIILSRPCIYGVFGGRFGGFKPIKHRCVGCMRCVQEYPHIMTVKYADEYRALGDSHWTPDSIFTVYYEASSGKIPIKGMGYKGSFGGEGWDGMWTDMSEIVRPTRDGVYGREYISTSVDIGRKPSLLNLEPGAINTLRILRSPLPVMFDHVPVGTTDNVDRAIGEASSRLGICHSSNRPVVIGPTDSLFVPIINDENVDVFGNALKDARIIEYEVDNSKPGFIDEIRSKHPSALLVARLALDEGAEEKACKLVQDEKVDVLHLFADYHGLDYSKSPRHVSRALMAIHTRLVNESIRDTTTIIISGGVTLAEHVPKAIICGADLVGLDTTLLVALQSEFRGESRDRENCGLKPQNIAPSWGAQRLVNLMASWHDQLIEILSAMGMRDVRRLRGDVGRSMTDHELREQAFEGIARQA